MIEKPSELLPNQFFDRIPFGFIQIDTSGNITYANYSAIKTLELKEENIPGLSYMELPLNHFDESGKTFKKENSVIFQALQGKTISGEIRKITSNKAPKWLSLNAAPIYDDKNCLAGAALNFFDVTEKFEGERNREEVKEGSSKNGIIQRTKNEELLKEDILNALSDGILIIDANGTILNINKRLSKYLIREKIRDLKLGNSIYSFIEELRESDFLKKSLKSLLRGDFPFFEYQIKLNDNKWYSLKASRISDQLGAVISFQNINTRKEIEMALEKSLKKYRNIYNRAPVMMHSLDSEGNIISVSDFWLEKMGYERNEVIGKPAKMVIDKSQHGMLERNQQELHDHGEIRNVNYRFIKKSGEAIDVVLGAVVEYDEEGKYELSLAGTIDITEQKKIEKDLIENRTKLLESQRLSRIGDYELDLTTGKFSSSYETNLIMGFSENDRDLSITEKLIHPEDYKNLIQSLEIAIKNKRDFFHIYRIHHLQTKKVRWISGRGKMVLNQEGEVIKMVGTIQDITEQRSAEDKIRKLSDRILLSTEIANLGVWEYDADLDEVIWEDQMYVIFPEAKKPYRLQEIKDIVLNEDPNYLETMIGKIKDGSNFLETQVLVRLDNNDKYLKTFTRITRTGSGRVKGMIGVVYDITDDKKLQSELEHSLEEKNILIREVHHRVKNNMQLISSIMALKSYELKDEDSRITFEEVNTRIKAMSVIYDRLHKFYNVSEIDIDQFLTQVTKELGILMGVKSIRLNIKIIKTSLGLDAALVLGLIVSEMVSNAIKHSFDEAEEGEITIQLGRLDEDQLFLSVTNDGKKIPEDVLSSHAGVGISMIETFARQLSGQLSLDDLNGFRVVF